MHCSKRQIGRIVVVQMVLKLQLVGKPGLTWCEAPVCSFYEGNQPSYSYKTTKSRWQKIQPVGRCGRCRRNSHNCNVHNCLHNNNPKLNFNSSRITIDIRSSDALNYLYVHTNHNTLPDNIIQRLDQVMGRQATLRSYYVVAGIWKT